MPFIPAREPERKETRMGMSECNSEKPATDTPTREKDKAQNQEGGTMEEELIDPIIEPNTYDLQFAWIQNPKKIKTWG